MVTSVASGAGDHDAPRQTNGSAAANLRQRRKHAAALLAHQGNREDAELEGRSVRWILYRIRALAARQE